MCNHYQNIPGAEKLLSTWKEYIGFDLPNELPVFANDIYPKRQGLVLRMEDGEVKADAMMWGQLGATSMGTNLMATGQMFSSAMSGLSYGMMMMPSSYFFNPFRMW